MNTLPITSKATEQPEILSYQVKTTKIGDSFRYDLVNANNNLKSKLKHKLSDSELSELAAKIKSEKFLESEVIDLSIGLANKTENNTYTFFGFNNNNSDENISKFDNIEQNSLKIEIAGNKNIENYENSLDYNVNKLTNDNAEIVNTNITNNLEQIEAKLTTELNTGGAKNLTSISNNKFEVLPNPIEKQIDESQPEQLLKPVRNENSEKSESKNENTNFQQISDKFESAINNEIKPEIIKEVQKKIEIPAIQSENIGIKISIKREMSNAEITKEYDMANIGKLNKNSGESSNSEMNNNSQQFNNGEKFSTALASDSIQEIVKSQAIKSEIAQAQSTENTQFMKYYDNVRLNDLPKITANIVKNLSSDTTTTAKLFLQPKSLGTVFVELQMTGDSLKLNFKTEKESVKQIIENQIYLLKDKLQNQGIKIENIDVKNFEQDAQSNQYNANNFKKDDSQKEKSEFIRSNSFSEARHAAEIQEEQTVAKKPYLTSGSRIETYI